MGGRQRGGGYGVGGPARITLSYAVYAWDIMGSSMQELHGYDNSPAPTPTTCQVYKIIWDKSITLYVHKKNGAISRPAMSNLLG